MRRTDWVVLILTILPAAVPVGGDEAGAPRVVGELAAPAGDSEIEAIKERIRASIEWAITKDRRLLESVLAHDERLFIFNPTSESTVGWSQLVPNFDFWMDARFKATTCDIRDLRIDLAHSGDVAWWSAVLDDLGEWDGRPIGWKDTRWTGVIERRDGAWVISQMHFSFASDKVASETRAKLQAAAGEPRQALSGDYLGQPPPGREPRIFAPGIVSTGLSERDVAITPDGNEIYFGRYVGAYRYAVIMVVRRVDGVWGEPEVAPFSGIPGVSDLEPALTYDGHRLYFLSDRPATPGAEGGQDIWYVERTGSSWGPATPLGPPVCTSAEEYFPSLTRDGTLYFTLQGDPSRPDGIYRARFHDGAFSTPERLPDHVNSGRARYNAFIAPDEGYLIYAIYGRPEGFGRSDYYVAFRSADDTWSEPVNLGPAFNSKADEEYSAYVTRDGRYLFFMSTRTPDPASVFGERVTADALGRLTTQSGNGNADIWWVEAEFLQALRPRPKVEAP